MTTEQKYPLGDKRIFVIEDQPDIRAVYEMMLKRYVKEIGFDFWGQESLKHLKAFGVPDILILDLMLPHGVSGFDVYDQIRELPQYKTTRVVAVSASEPSTVLRKLKAKGFSGLVTKPFDIMTFPKKLVEVMKSDSFVHIHYSTSSARFKL
ncbi:MAG: response regulator [Chloroflexota bacterium]